MAGELLTFGSRAPLAPHAEQLAPRCFRGGLEFALESFIDFALRCFRGLELFIEFGIEPVIRGLALHAFKVRKWIDLALVAAAAWHLGLSIG